MSNSKVNNVKHIDLDQIKDPKFLKDLSYKELDVLASDIRSYLLDKTSKYGGHLSSNLGAVELTIALHRSFDFTKDKLIFDVGHQSYTHKILTGRSLEKLRTQEGVSGFQKMNESVYDPYEAGHSSTSISAANGFAIARDLNNEKYDIVAFVGDSSIVSGLAFEGLNNIAHSDHKVIIVLNDNGMSISKPVGGLAKSFAKISTSAGYNRFKSSIRRRMNKKNKKSGIYKFFSSIKNWFKRHLVAPNIFQDLGFAYIGPVDGHNIKAIEKAIARAKNTSKSVVIHACTLKGKGYQFAENDETGYWHGVSPFNIETGKPNNLHEGQISWSHLYSDLCESELEEHKNAILISPATIKGAGLDNLSPKYKDRVIDVGIAEEHAVTLASALSLSGYHPIISIYSTFLQRAYDEVSHDLARMNCSATFLVDRSGLVGADGETHQGIYDEAYLSSIPNVTITIASNADEAKALFDESFAKHGPFFIRLPRTLLNKPEKINSVNIPYGTWIKLAESSKKDLAIISCGPSVRELLPLLKENNIDATVVNAIYLNPIDKKMLDELLGYSQIVIYDPYSTQGSLVNLTSSYLLEKKFKGALKAFSIPNTFVKQGSINQQLERFGLLPSQIIAQLKQDK